MASYRLSTGGLLFSSVALAVALAISTSTVEAFSPPQSQLGLASNNIRVTTTTIISSTELYNRSARRKDTKKKKRRQPAFIEEEEESDNNDAARNSKKNEPILLGGGEIGYTNEVPDTSKIPIATATSKDSPPPKSKLDQELSGERIVEKDGTLGESVVSSASISDYVGEVQPDVTTVVTDPDTGIARIQQGKYVMDKDTGKAVVLSSMGPEYRLAQMFPGVSPDVRDQYRFDWNSVTVPQMVEQLRAACTVPLKNSSTGKE